MGVISALQNIISRLHAARTPTLSCKAEIHFGGVLEIEMIYTLSCPSRDLLLFLYINIKAIHCKIIDIDISENEQRSLWNLNQDSDRCLGLKDH
jgi:hypothetical protein